MKSCLAKTAAMWRRFQRKGRTYVSGNLAASKTEYSTGLSNRKQSTELKTDSSFVSLLTETCYRGKNNLITEKKLFIKDFWVWYQNRGLLIMLD